MGLIFTVKLSTEDRHVIQDLTKALSKLTIALSDRQTLIGGEIVFIVKDDHPDESYVLAPVAATDAEGVVIPNAKIIPEVTSDNVSAVAVTPSADGTGGSVKFGSPNVDGTPAQATVT